MSKIVKKSFSNPDVKPDFPKVDARTLEMGDGVKVSRVVAEHGWKWSECVKPSIGTDSCQASHIGVLAKGSMTVRMDDGTEVNYCLLYTSPSPRDRTRSRMPSSA